MAAHSAMFISFGMKRESKESQIFLRIYKHFYLTICTIAFFFRQKTIKLLKEKYFPGDNLNKSIGKIENEINILRKLEHPLVLKYYEYFLEYDEMSEQGSLAIVTEYCSVCLYIFLILHIFCC